MILPWDVKGKNPKPRTTVQLAIYFNNVDRKEFWYIVGMEFMIHLIWYWGSSVRLAWSENRRLVFCQFIKGRPWNFISSSQPSDVWYFCFLAVGVEKNVWCLSQDYQGAKQFLCNPEWFHHFCRLNKKCQLGNFCCLPPFVRRGSVACEKGEYSAWTMHVPPAQHDATVPPR